MIKEGVEENKNEKKGWINWYVICFVIMKIDVGYWSLSDLVVSFD